MDEAAERQAALAEALARIRHLANSKLENQKAPAQLLVAIEATLAERGEADRGPTAYLLALESLLGAHEDVASPVFGSSVYLLSVVLPHVAPGVVRAKAGELLGIVAQPLAHAQAAGEHGAALTRSALACVEGVFGALQHRGERGVLEHERTWAAVWDLVLRLCVDARPKVRRRAQELVVHELGRPVWAHDHPYAARTVHWAAGVLDSVAVARGSGSGSARGSTAPTYDKRTGSAKHAMTAAATRQAQAEGSASTGIWVCALLKGVVDTVQPASAAPLARELLRLPALQNPYLTVVVFEVFASMFKRVRPAAVPAGARESVAALAGGAAAAAFPVHDTALLRTTVDALLDESLVPAPTDTHTLPAYLTVLEDGMVALSRVDEGAEAWARFPATWALVMDRSLSGNAEASRTSPAVREAGRNALLALVRYCIPDAAIAATCRRAGKAPDAKRESADSTPLGAVLRSIRDALGKHALRFTHARAEVLQVLAALIARLRHAPSLGERRAAEVLLMDTVVHVASLRAQRDFDARPEADAVIGAAIEACGPGPVLHRLPLQLLGPDGRPNTSGTGRGWLLPILREHITNTALTHFVQELVPLSHALFELRTRAEQPQGPSNKPRHVEAKVLDALLEQVWACFPKYCDLATDVDAALTPELLEMLISVLRTQPALRPSVLKGLELLVQRSETLAASSAPAAALRRDFSLDQDAARRHLAHLRSLAGVLLAALFNLLAELPSQARGPVTECIGTYLSVLDTAGVHATYERVVGLLRQSLAAPTPAPRPGAPEANSPRYVPPVPHTMLDLLIVLVPYVSAEDAGGMLELCLGDALLTAKDGGLQKKTYRVLARLLSGTQAGAVLRRGGGGDAAAGAAQLLAQLVQGAEAVQPGAVRDRLTLLGTLVPHTPSTQLQLLTALAPEAVLGTKEANQGAREAAYELLVQMAQRMRAGGTLERPAAAPGAEPETAEASVHEFVMMLAAGLAGSSSRMISASLTALARLLYEYHTELPADTLDELLSTDAVFLESTNRDVVKSALGFAKVGIVALDTERLRAHLGELLPALVGVRGEHRNHFKAQVRHLVERLIRRFGVETVEAHVDEENRRLVTNIRKRKDRAKRKRAAGAEADTDEAAAAAAPAPDSFKRAAGTGTVDAFEEALYGSDSDEASDSEEEPAPAPARRGRGERGRQQRMREDDTYIREDDDVPMDLMDQSATGAIRAGHGDPRGKRRRAPGAEAKHFAVDEATGRMRIEDEEAQATEPDADAAAGAGTAYLDRERGVDGFTHRGRGGAVKFNKNTKRTREAERAEEEAEDAAEPAAAPAKRQRRRNEKQAIGREFRAKRAEGDVSRKGGMSPYAYVPLSSVAGKKKGQGPKLRMTGRGR